MLMNEYENNLKAAYDPTTPSENLQVILDSFLKFKSEVVNHRAGCPKEVEDVIQHLREKVSKQTVTSPSGRTNYETVLYYIAQHPLGVALFSGLIISIIGWLVQ
jgi:hypothetical protein